MIAMEVTANLVGGLVERIFVGTEQGVGRGPVNLIAVEDGVQRLLYDGVHSPVLYKSGSGPVGFDILGRAADDHLGDAQLNLGKEPAFIAQKA